MAVVMKEKAHGIGVCMKGKAGTRKKIQVCSSF